MKFLAITLARAGSKRIKNKNLLKISGSNLLEISYLNSIKSKFFKEIYLSTESKKIAMEGKKLVIKFPSCVQHIYQKIDQNLKLLF